MPTNYPGSSATYPSTIPIPADGEEVCERNWAGSWQRLADRAAWLKRVLPTPYSHTSDSAGNALWTYGNSGNLETTIAAGHYVDIPNTRVGDIIQVDFFGVWKRTGSSNAVGWDGYLDAIDNATGSSPGTQTHLGGAHWDVTSGITTTDIGEVFPLSMSGGWTVSIAGTTRISFALKQQASWSADTFTLRSSLNFVAILYPQS